VEEGVDGEVDASSERASEASATAMRAATFRADKSRINA
jgi:hypothetical protein